MKSHAHYPHLRTASLAALFTGLFALPIQGQEDLRHFWSYADHFFISHESTYAVISDQNGDDIPDLIASKPWANAMNPLITILSGADGRLIRREVSDEQHNRFGRGVANAGDVDGDGIEDYMIGIPSQGPHGGEVWVRSGATSEIIWQILGGPPEQDIGGRVAGVGDVNQDGFADFAYSGGGTWVHSGATGQLHLQLAGGNFIGAGDLNADGFDDLVIADKHYSTPYGNTGAVSAFSGWNGEVLWRATGLTSGSWFGHSLSSAADINHDGTPEILVGAPYDLGTKGRAFVLNGRDGSFLHAIEGENADDKFGYSVASLGDFNGDGIPDFMFGAPQRRRHDYVGYADVYSTSNFKRIARITDYQENCGSAILAPGDLNRDGRADAIVLSKSNDWRAYLRATGMNSFLYASQNQISSSFPNRVDFEITFPDTERGRSYRILSSFTGTGPTLIGNFSIPLSWDPLLEFGLNGSVPPGSKNFVGRLDYRGHAQATLFGGTHLAKWAGNKIYLAAISFSSIGHVKIGRNTSYPTELKIVP